ncbi:VOC family protein [Bacillus alkalicellulosilyticus]|uniref:VOC family protein n=1 Tax=Alkalihalobacterium alkalicellulosilyticum TaxID=1912214 RepID=UPI0009968304|nr:VOC family protein [Bacillus alkalicellulosilyticus]
MKLRVGAVFIPVLNLEESIGWYKEILDLQLVDQWGAGASLNFKTGEALVALIQVQQKAPLHFHVGIDQTNVYFHFETDDLDSLRRHFEYKGVEITNSYDHELMNEIFIRDPSGNQISFFCEKEESPFYKHASGKVSW